MRRSIGSKMKTYFHDIVYLSMWNWKPTFIRQCLQFSRNYHQNEVRVRFAPSPTGFLHLGGLRTALYNFLFAKSKRGSFILRIEDTDQTRLVQGATEQLCKDLEWAGIVPDESFVKGGNFGPYVQSERSQLYISAAYELVENGAAYFCFCTPHRLEMLRKDALRRRQVPRYDNRCRSLTKVEAQAKINSGAESCIRLKLLSGYDKFEDLISGCVSHDISAIEGDPVILKTDGYPTYHLANVVDDHHMCITHVLRGVEWQASTPKHLMLYKGFGWSPPKFAHLPLLLNADGTKLSKRQGDVTVAHYRATGTSPRALINFVTFSGGGFHRTNSEQVQSLDMDQLASQFDLGLIGAASCRVSLDRLDDFNRVELVRQMSDAAEFKAIVVSLKTLVKDKYKDRLDSLELEDSFVRSVLIWSQKRVSRLCQLVEPEYSYLWIRPPVVALNNSQAELLHTVYERLKNIEDFTQQSLSHLLRSFAKEKNVKIKDLMHLLRRLLCGKEEGPAVAEVLEMLGRKTVLIRMQASLSHQKQDC